MSRIPIKPEPLSEEELSEFMQRRIENGELDPEDIPVRLARYGLLDPNDFVSEMRERMELEAAEIGEQVLDGKFDQNEAAKLPAETDAIISEKLSVQ